MRARPGSAAALGSLLMIATSVGCEAVNLGEPPPDGSFFFPSGVLLDPVHRLPDDAACQGIGELPPSQVVLPSTTLDLPGSRYLYVANGNNDRRFNAGTILAVDLQEFWRAWYDPHRDDPAQASCVSALAEARAAGAGVTEAQVIAACDACQARDPRRGGLDPYCHEDDDGSHGRCVLGPGSSVPEGRRDEARPCRRLPLLPHIAECDEGPFVIDSVHVGNFAATLAASVEPDGHTRLWLPVRGDPSVTYVDVDPQAERMFDCDQDPDALDPELCGDAHRLETLRSDPELEKLDREPFNTLVWESSAPSDDPDVRGQRLGFVAHADGPQMTVIDLDGVRGGTDPAIVDLAPLFSLGGGSAGGFGLAARPCFEAGQGPLGALDPEPNVPAVTQGCRRPLIYSSLRFAAQLASFTASGLDLGAEVEDLVPAIEREDCSIAVNPGCDLADPEGTGCTTDCGSSCVDVFAGSYCATPDQLGQPCAVECEPQVRGQRRFPISLLIDSSLRSGALLGDLAFADPRGDQLLVVQTNPGALLSVDTSLSDDGEPLDIPSAPPIEICAEPSRMKIYTERTADGAPAQRYALITCFRAALVYVVDLEALRVVDAVVVGTGPHDLVIDDDREVAYVINNLEFSISVIDLSRRRSTRFQELARLGLQDPFSQ